MDKKQNFPLVQNVITAGFPSQAENDIEMQLDLNEHLIKHPASTFFVKVHGDSMRGVGIFSGDILIVDKSLDATNGKIVVAILNGEFTVKKLSIQKDSIQLVPANNAYPIINITAEMDFQVWGVVTYVIHKPS